MDTSELLDKAEALATLVDDPEPEPYWAAVREIYAVPSEEVFRRCMAWSESLDELLRRLAVNCLAQLGYSEDFPYRDKTYPILRRTLDSGSPALVADALTALGHLSPGPCRDQVCSYAAHHETEVRSAVVFALLGDESPEAIATLITMSDDTDSNVRDWATFGLGTQIDTDTPDIRAALLARASDSDGNTRAEAISGLVRREDPRVIPLLCATLSKPDVGTLEVEAAETMPHVSLVQPLERLRGWWDVDSELLERAIAACRAVARPDG